MPRSLTRAFTGLVLALAGASTTPAHGGFLYVSSFGNDRVYQLDSDTGSVLMTYSDAGFLDSPTGLALSPDGNILYVGATNASNSDVVLFNTATGARITQYSSSLTGARGLALSGDGSALYVAGIGTDNVVRFNTANGSPSAVVTGSLSNPQGLQLAPDGNSLFIANSGGNNTLRKSVTTGATLTTYAAPGSFYSPSDVELSPDGSTLYVSTFGDSSATNNKILRYNAATGSFLGSWTVAGPEGDLYGLALNTAGSTLFVSDVFNNQIYTVDTATGVSSPFNTTAALSNPAFLVFSPTPAAVPEPSSLALLSLCGAFGAGAAWRGRRRASAATARRRG